MKSVLFIINPKAGSAKLQIFSEQATDFADCLRTQYAGHGTLLAQEAIKQGYRVMVAVGGDGTVNEIATALLHTDCALGIVPMGSGNGLARELGFSMNVEHCIDQIKQATETQSLQYIDAGVVDFGTEKKHFFCTAGLGFDAHCAVAFANNPRQRGLKNYVRIVWQEFWKYRFPEITVNGTPQKVFSLTFANARQFGNNAYISPEAKPNDGLLNLSLIKPFSILEGVFLVFRLFFKSIHLSKKVITEVGRAFNLEFDEPMPMHYDGEPLPDVETPISINILPKALKTLKVQS